ncbi:hypothetical protein HHK36_013608 [Tetracentron sinense]|uniref:Uncharacterized protein n=1 Tax=Tetracentron sinense TaxID=13715 RepID=A0A834ZAP3_TETSI|nr:hypothetical protein HHK36_013608 [Tetracentron sinense]
MECKDFLSEFPENTTEKTNGCTVSLLQGEEIFFNRILSRDSSKGFSSRIYHRTAEGVPFKWETQPGKSRTPLMNGSIPPLSPPPAAQSLSLPKLCTEKPKDSAQPRVWFWKKIVKTRQIFKKKRTGLDESISDVTGSKKVENFEFWSSDSDSVSSPRNSISSWRSSSSASHFETSLQTSKFSAPKSQKKVEDSEKWGGIERLDLSSSCIPWNFTGVLICLARRV